MTVIAAFKDKNKYWIASDSMGSAGMMKYELGSKLISHGNYIIGFSWSYRVADIIKECRDLPDNINGIKDIRFLRDVLKEYVTKDGMLDCNDNYCDEGRHGARHGANNNGHPIDLIIICPSGMYTIENDYQIHKVPDGYIACGSGTEVAMGTLYCCKKLKISGDRSVKLAVEAATKHVITCGGKCHLKSVEKSNGKRNKDN